MADKKTYDSNLQIALWERQSPRDGSVFLSGQLEIDGVKYNVTLNESNSDNPKAPKWRGKLKQAD
jgi:hypothetical protein